MSTNKPNIAALIEKHFGPGAEVAMSVLGQIMRGELTLTKEVRTRSGEIVTQESGPTVEERLEAAKLALAYTYGLPKSSLTVEHTESAGPVLDWTALSPEESKTLYDNFVKKMLPPDASAIDAEFTEAVKKKDGE